MILHTMIAIAIVSLVSLIGVVALSISTPWLKRISLLLVSLAAGTLIGDTFLHLLPEALEETANPTIIWLAVIGGILLFFVLEKIIHWRHCHIPVSPEHTHPLGIMNLVGDGLHNFFDGMLIAGSFIVSPSLGVATTLAVIFHEIPQEIGDFGVLIHAGFSRARALWFNFLSALAAFAGAFVVIFWSQVNQYTADFLVPVTAGGFLYIAVSDLIPELKKENGVGASSLQLLMILVGLGIMYLIKIFG